MTWVASIRYAVILDFEYRLSLTHYPVSGQWSWHIDVRPRGKRLYSHKKSGECLACSFEAAVAAANQYMLSL